jgi:DNA-binding MarR family transcriptional regulator
MNAIPMPSSEHDERILLSLRRICRALDIHSRELVRDHQLTGPQVVCLREIARSSPIMPSELARRVSLSQATVTGILDRLAERRLITRRRNPQDKRRVMVRLTDAGRLVTERVPSPLQDRFRSRLSSLPVDAQDRIDAVLADIVEMMEVGDIEPIEV